MIHPSYVELMNIVNEGSAIGEEPVVNSRYSIVCATAKRARQLTDGAEPLIEVSEKDRAKSLLIAVEELWQGKLKILTPEEAAREQERMEAEAEERRRETMELRREAEAAWDDAQEADEADAEETYDEADEDAAEADPDEEA